MHRICVHSGQHCCFLQPTAEVSQTQPEDPPEGKQLCCEVVVPTSWIGLQQEWGSDCGGIGLRWCTQTAWHPTGDHVTN